jgi:hypothetical protein
MPEIPQVRKHAAMARRDDRARAGSPHRFAAKGVS